MRVVRVENGDTIIVGVDGKAETVHLLGIDAPDEGQPGYAAAAEALRVIVRPGQTVYLVRDVTDRDECDFLLRYVYLPDGKQANAYMMATGYAQPKQVPPDVSQSEEFYELAVAAGQRRKGFWTGLSNYDGVPAYGLVRNDVILRNGPRNDYSLGSSVSAATRP